MRNKKKWLCLALSSLPALGMIPLPVLAEEAPAAASEEADPEKVTPETITYASSWEEIYKALSSAVNHRYQEVYTYAEDSVASMELVPKMETSAAAASSSDAPADYSSTNLRDQAVDEADIVKTDGKYLYILQNSRDLTIVKAEEEQSETLCKLPLYSYSNADSTALLSAEENVSYRETKEMFLSGDHLIVLLEEQHSDTDSSGYWHSRQFTRMLTLDISDPSAPQLVGSYTQEGSYAQARRTNGVTYLYTTLWPELGSGLSDSRLAVSVGGQELSPESYCIPKVITDQSFLIYSSIRDEAPETAKNAGVFVSGGEQFYVSESSLYVANSYWNRTQSQTQITRFSQTDGAMEGVASCILNGYVNNTWSLDEYDGRLRVLVTYYGLDFKSLLSNLLDGDGLIDSILYSQDQRMNALVVLDENLQKVSQIRGIGKNEEIKSARFMGDTAYFVTYENTDPLFRVDLSDPANPKLLDSLKIDGFSAYLHPFGADRLLGIGYDTDPVSGSTLGVKLTMFDTSAPGELTVLHTLTLPGITYCPAIADYKSIFVSPDKSLLGFYYNERYLLYSYEEGEGFSMKRLYDLLPAGLAGTGNFDTMRGLYIGEEFYLAGGSYVAGFSLTEDPAKEFVLKM